MSNKSLNKYLGYKFYIVDEDDNVDLVRLTDILDDDKITIKRVLEDKNVDAFETISVEDLKHYTPLEPNGFVMINRVLMGQGPEATEDVIVALYRMIDVKLNMNEPFALCRQSVNDFFYDMINTESENKWVGVSCTRENCPAVIQYSTLAACDDVLDTKMVNFYLDDVVEDILGCIDTTKFDKTLNKLYIEHMKHLNPLYIENEDDNEQDYGWCRSLKVLLRENNFINDMDTMRNITAFDVDLYEYMELEDEEAGAGVYKFNDELLKYFNYIFKINAMKTIVVKYDYDINMGDFNNNNYILVRDKNNVLFIVVYTTEGEYLYYDLEDDMNKLGIGDKLRLAYYNKYSV